MSKRISISVFIFTLLAAILITFMTAFAVVSRIYDDELRDAYLDNPGGDSVTQPSGEYPELKLLESIFKNYSYFDLEDEKIMDSVLKAYAGSTGDKYAEYYTAEEFEAMTSENAGEMQGVGINIIQNTEYDCIEVISVMPDSPALEAGVQPGDLIFYVGRGETRESVSSLGYTNAVKKLQGLAGTMAEFVVRRGADLTDEVEFSIKRGYVTTQSVTYRIASNAPSVGIVKVIQFDLTTPGQFSAAVDALRASGINEFVFDLRYNPGGDLQSIIAVLSYFLNEDDVIISTLDKAGNKTVDKVRVSHFTGDYAGCSVSETDIGKYKGLKCVVLVNDNTASAAELFTANFRDYKLAPIIGVTTYGKGSMQSIMSLQQFGYTGGVKLTTKMYFPPCGESYEGIGIAPDIEVELNEAAAKVNIYKLPDTDDNQLQRGIEELFRIYQ